MLDKMTINVTRPSIPKLEEYIEEIKPIFENHFLTNMGPVYEKFRDALLEYLEVEDLELFVNGHMALETAINALGLSEKGRLLGGGEVITTPYTFVSTTHAITRNNLIPVFCDINKNDCCMDPNKIEELITDKTVAILPVHVYGHVCDTTKIEQIAKKHNLKVIYDGAHAFGERLNGVAIGNFGDATMFSFHATKVFNSIEGGAIAFKDEKYKLPLRELKNFGIHDEESVDDIGFNAKLDEFRAAMGICNLRTIQKSIEAREKIYNCYIENLGGVEGIDIFRFSDRITPNYAYFPVRFNKSILGFDRNDVCHELKKNGINSRKYFYPAVNEMKCYKHLNVTDTPNAHEVSLSILTLPIYEELLLDDVNRICDVILRML